MVGEEELENAKGQKISPKIRERIGKKLLVSEGSVLSITALPSFSV
jgi:hypothetical protein